ncbi:MAG: hypothetical protein H6849_00160 [Alphaproteobacteria bacterium]|nr:MAG: hypothetical protein H6849_00160 [Alphaproteobacteria bacterium]
MLTYTFSHIFAELGDASIHSGPVFWCEIREREATRPRVRLRIPYDDQNSGILLSWITVQGKKTLFTGRVTKFMHSHGEKICDIEAVSDHPDNSSLMGLVGEDLRKDGAWCSDLYALDETHVGNFLNSQLMTPGWDRTTGKFTLSHIFTGRTVHALTDFNTVSFKQMHVSHKPLKAVNLRVLCRWKKKVVHTIDLGAHMGGDRMLRTITPDRLKQQWPREGTTLSGTSLRVVSSHLEEGAKPEIQLLPLHNHHQESFTNAPVSVYCFRPVLTVADETTVLVHEVFEAVLTHDYQGKQDYDLVKDLTVDLGVISLHESRVPWETGTFYDVGSIVSHQGGYYLCVSAHRSAIDLPLALDRWCKLDRETLEKRQAQRKSCFIHDAAQRVLRHMAQLARGYLANSARGIASHFRVPLAHGIDVSTLDAITWNSSQERSSSLYGKVTQVRIVIDRNEQFVDITAMSAIGVLSQITPCVAEKNQYGAETEEYVGSFCVSTPEDMPDLLYVKGEDLDDYEERLDKENLGVSSILIHNTAEEQLTHLHKEVRMHRRALHEVSIPSTYIAVNAQMCESSGIRHLHKTHRAEFGSGWSAPANINLLHLRGGSS